MRIYLTLILFLIVSNLSGMPPTFNQELLERVLHRLYYANAVHEVAPPAVRIVNENTLVAAYRKRTHTIEIDTKLMNICEKFGAKKEDALAFVLGHELWHALQKKQVDDGYLARYRKKSVAGNAEWEADVAGAFTAYLAGYLHVATILPELLEAIYQEYTLSDTKLTQYPRLNERKATFSKVIGFTKELIDLYEVANFLVVLGQYELAEAVYKSVLKSYKTAGIYNNIGVCMILQAIRVAAPNLDPYHFPLELITSLPLQLPEKYREQEQASHMDVVNRNRLLKDAATYFWETSKLNKNLPQLEINRRCLYILTNRAGEVVDLPVNHPIVQFSEKLSLCKGLALAYQSQPAANAIFRTLRTSKTNSTATIAAFNQAVVQGFGADLNACTTPEGLKLAVSTADLLTAQKSSSVLAINHTLTLASSETREARIYLFKKENQNALLLKIARLKNQTFPVTLLANPESYLAICPEYRLACKINNPDGSDYLLAAFREWK